MPLKIKAFTLVELIITLAVAAILAAIAAPSFADIIKSNRLTTQINELAAALNLSRSEAIKRGLTVTTCRSSDGTSCTGSWQDGWIVFQDVDDDGVVDAGDTVLLVHSSLSTGNTLNFTGGGNRVAHEASGYAIGHAGTFRLCDDRGAATVKGLVVSNTGRIRTADSSSLSNCS
jgi:type IV fimbrial biogenesis protein FimT